MLVLGFMLIGLGIFIVCLAVIDGVREAKENKYSGFKDFIIIGLMYIVEIISDLWGFRLFFIFIGLACIVFGVTILIVELY
ncbi:MULTISPECIES: hypothetical protein [Bacillus cereus group]|uniref:Uncharacterized protein n=2 Tax=Bacillus cereus TaxID=1396 RepID=A0A2B1CKK8_BACCE|nr:hypothetical protein [Bacillus cereus]EJQ73381.1 hypothetical protein IGC_05052 [Bacillus cereus HuA4-10]PDY77525.1 hypothetical protein CON06_26245 [Bacillus cereus]PFA13564.1 hypothetical protein CN382_13150 [Bacillus cereus]PFM29250.1 hypothetical protein COJ43_29950 [Bacillus cereus]PGL56618.1 hypothetical protein CN927_27715 [Bacillus cereus]